MEMSESSHSKMSNSYEEPTKYYRKALVYLPFNEYCQEHTEFFLHEDEKLVKTGDKFPSHGAFVQYLNENAKRWCFYYRCSDSHKPNTESETYTYNCVYLRNKEKYKKQGIRKRNNNMKTDCPCRIKLRRLPNEAQLTVVHVCNHHDHELSLQEFYKLQHGRRLPHYVKEEVMDFLALKVNIMKIKAYVEMETGFNMSRPFFYALEKTMKVRKMARQITPRRLALLQEKIAAVDEMIGDSNEDSEDLGSTHNVQDYSILSEATKKKSRRSMKNAERVSGTPPVKRRSKGNVVVMPDGSKRTKISVSAYNTDEILQSVKHLQESVKCEIQKNPWVTDQCVPVLPDRTGVKLEWDKSVQVQAIDHINENTHSEAQNDMETLSYTIEYYDPDDSNGTEIISNDFAEIINEGQVAENGIENIAYETVVTNDNDEAQHVVQEYVEQEQIINEDFEIQIEPQEDQAKDDSETVNDNVNNTQDIVELENHVEYVSEDIVGNDSLVQYVGEINDESNAQDIGVQTATDDTSSHALLPVFDVYMKDGNVTGFVVNDNLIGGLKDGVDKEIQTSEETILSDLLDLEKEAADMITHCKSGDTYIKHEYVHKYNLDKYMVQPHFPQYVATLAKETSTDILNMFTNIYNEKAMFKMTTTQKGKEGNTRIWYVTDFPRHNRYKKDEVTTEKLGKNLQSVLLLKEKLRASKRKYKELYAQHRKLEEVALRLVEITGDDDDDE